MIKKILLLIMMTVIISFHLFCDTKEASYLLSDTSRELYDTGKVRANNFIFTFGEHRNIAISPNVFNSYGFGSETIRLEPLGKRGALVFQTRSTVSLLFSTVPNPAENVLDITSWNFKLQGYLNVHYLFKIPTSVNKLTLKAAPYLQLDYLVGVYPKIMNIPIQPFFSINLGGIVSGQYEFLKIFRIGADFSTFIIGMDTGRSGYNKEYMPDILFSHYGNYMDLSLELYGELDISRTESIRLGYTHKVTSYFGGENSVISGEHQLCFSYYAKLIR